MTLGDVTSEGLERLGRATTEIPVYGVDRTVGLTASPKYVADDLSRYKRLHPGMFAYNPMRLNIGSIGYCSDKHAPGLVSPDYVVFRCNPTRLNSDFLKHYIQSPIWREWAAGSGVGSVRVRIYFRELARMPVLLPPIEEQGAIARILGALDDKIELNRRMNETLEAMARVLFKSWFLDFDPVRAKVEGRTPYLASDLWSLFPDALDVSGHPQGWRPGILLDLCELKRGYDLPKAERSLGPIPIISSSGISGHHAVPMAQPPGVVTGRYGTIGEVYFVNRAYWPLNTALYVRDFKGNSPRVVYYLLRQIEFLQYSDKAAVPGINRNHLHQAPVTLPPPPIQEAFERLLTPLWARQEVNNSEAATLAALHDTLLPKLISGELRVKEAERQLEAAL